MIEAVGSLRTSLKLIHRAGPRPFWLLMLLVSLDALRVPACAYLVKVLVDQSVVGNGAAAVSASCILGTVLLLGVLANVNGFELRVRLQEQTAFRMDEDLIHLGTGLPSLGEQDEPAYRERVAMILARRESFGGAVDTLYQSVHVALSVCITVVLLARVSGWLLLLGCGAVPVVLAGVLGGRLASRASDRTSLLIGQAEHIFGLATEAVAAKELRISGIGRDLLRRHDAMLRHGHATLARAELLGALCFIGGWVVFVAAYAGAILVVVAAALQRRATLGDVSLVAVLGAQLCGQVALMVASISGLTKALGIATHYRWLSQHVARHAQQARTSAPLAVPDTLQAGITVEAVSFHYPGCREWVLRDLDFRVPAGSTVAIVGENGAGKSTLVKLLCGLYDPVQGRILADGVDLRAMDASSWRTRVSATFQDFACFRFRVRASVGVGELAAMDDERRIAEALHRAEATHMVMQLPGGLATQLGAAFTDGVDLSRGQWQKLALSRGFMRIDPLLLVLDEPSAALDAESENELFESYAAAARGVATATGAITVLVSHRLATARLADMILVLRRGSIAEIGSHDDLVANGGVYSELYALNAAGYR